MQTKRKTFLPVFLRKFLFHLSLLILWVLLLNLLRSGVCWINSTIRSIFVWASAWAVPDIDLLLIQHGAAIEWRTLIVTAFTMGFALMALSMQRMIANCPYKLSEYVPLSKMCVALVWVAVSALYISIAGLKTLACLLALALNVYSICLSITVYSYHTSANIAAICADQLQKHVESEEKPRNEIIADECHKWYYAYLSAPAVQTSMQESAEQFNEVLSEIEKSRWIRELSMEERSIVFFQLGYYICDPSMADEERKRTQLWETILRESKQLDGKMNHLTEFHSGLLLAEAVFRIMKDRTPINLRAKMNHDVSAINGTIQEAKRILDDGYYDKLMTNSSQLWMGICRVLRFMQNESECQKVLDAVAETALSNHDVKLPDYETSKTGRQNDVDQQRAELLEMVDTTVKYHARDIMLIGIKTEEERPDYIQTSLNLYQKYVENRSALKTTGSVSGGRKNTSQGKYKNYANMR